MARRKGRYCKWDYRGAYTIGDTILNNHFIIVVLASRHATLLYILFHNEMKFCTHRLQYILHSIYQHYVFYLVPANILITHFAIHNLDVLRKSIRKMILVRTAYNYQPF